MRIPPRPQTRDARRFRVILSALGTACLAGACDSAPAVPAPDVSPDTWAIVDGRPITRDDVEKAYRRAQGAQALSDEEVMTAKLGVLDDLIVEDLLLAKAAALKIQVPASDLDAAYADARKDISDEAFQQELTRRKLSAGDMREGLRRELLSQKVLDSEIGSKITVTDREVSDFFNANRDQFNLPEDAYRVAQIVVTPVRDPQTANRAGDDATTPQAAADKVRMLMERLKAGERFGDLARDHSEDPQTAPRGGDLGLVPASALKQAPPPLRDAVLKSAPGAVRVVTVAGVHTLVVVLGQEKAGQRDLSMPQVRESITATLRGRREQLLRTAYLTALTSDADVVNYLARSLVESPGKVPGLVPAAPGSK